MSRAFASRTLALLAAVGERPSSAASLVGVGELASVLSVQNTLNKYVKRGLMCRSGDLYALTSEGIKRLHEQQVRQQQPILPASRIATLPPPESTTTHAMRTQPNSVFALASTSNLPKRQRSEP